MELVNRGLVKFSPNNKLQVKNRELEALQFILPLSTEYPGIKDWYIQKVMPGMSTGIRKLILVERDGKIAGVGIAKKEADENKICTVRVAPEFFGRGIGLRLFDSLLDWLGDSSPHLTVSEQKLPAFDRIFHYYGFDQTAQWKGLYVPGMTELGFNDAVSSDHSDSAHIGANVQRPRLLIGDE